MTKQELETRIRRQAGDLIYCWIYDSDIQYLGKNANAIITKRNKQLAYLKGLAYGTTGVKEDDIYAWVADEISKTYQKIKNPATLQYENATPRLIIAALMLGETVKGKNWANGVYGCKVGNTDLTQSKATIIGGGAPMVQLNGTTSFNLTGSQYDSQMNFDLSKSTSEPAMISTIDKLNKTVNNWTLNTETGDYDFATVSNGVTTLSANKTQVSASQQDLWTNITNACQQIQGLISGFAEFLSGITAPDALMPVQVEDGWVEPEPESNSGGSLKSSTGLILGGSLIASAFLLNNKKKK